MKYITAACAMLAFSGTLGASAGAVQHDGLLPMYPRAHVVGGGAELPSGILARGTFYQQTTADSVHLVDLWFQSNVHGCLRVARATAVAFRCAGGVIKIQPDAGKTLISYSPPQQ